MNEADRAGIPLTRTQEKIYTHCRLNPGTATYHASLAFDIRGPLDSAALEIAVDEVVARHDMLRAQVVANGAKPLFVRHDEHAITLQRVEFEDFEALASDPRSPLLHANRPFDLESEPLARFVLVRHRNDHFTFCIVVHHLVTDLWSMNLLCGELTSVYDSCITGADPALPAISGTFGEYAAEEIGDEGTADRHRAVAYWRSVLRRGVWEVPLPFDPPPDGAMDPDRDVPRTRLDEETGREVRALAERLRCTPFVVLLSAFYVFLHRLTGQERISIGSFFANRSDPRFVNVCGLLFNDLPITIDCPPRATFEEMVTRVNQEILDLLPHARTPFDRALVAEASAGTGDVLYEQHNVTCQLYEGAANRLKLAGCEVQQKRFFYGSKYDLMLYGSLTGDGLELWFSFQATKFDRNLISSWLDAFSEMFRRLVSSAEAPIGDLRLFRAELASERLRLKQIRSGGDMGSVIHEVDVRAEESADEVALVGQVADESVELTYRQLCSWSSRIADALVSDGLEIGDRVGVYCGRGAPLVAAHLGVLRAGGVSVPLNTDYPSARLRYIVRDSQAKLVVTDLDPGSAFAGLGIITPGPPDAQATGPHRAAVAPRSDSDAAFLIYTSGTSGTPKGVLLSHRGVRNQVLHRVELLGATADSTHCVSLSTGFVTLPLQILVPLFVGARLLAYPERIVQNPQALFAQAASDRVSALEVTVSQLDHFVRAAQTADSGNEVPTTMVAGEKLRASSVTAFHRQFGPVRLINAYGQTECTGMTLCRVLDADWRPPLDEGHASRNNVVMVLDAHGRALPPGFIGEICVAGDGLALGYWTSDGPTQEESFVEHETLGRLYRTGDLGRTRFSGSIEVLGREDGQVKLRGVRIEPGEIEEHLLAIQGVEACAVVARPNVREELALVAYIQASPEIRLDDSDLRAQLRSSLPEIMIPSVFQRVDQLPLSPNGKIDRSALPDPSPYGIASATREPTDLSEVEQVVLRLWRSALELPTLDVNHNFFAAGGTSLQAVVLVGEIAGVFGIDLSLDMIFRSPTAKDLSAVIVQLRNQSKAPER